MARSINTAEKGKVFTRLEYVLKLDDPELDGIRIQISVEKDGIKIKEVGRKEWTMWRRWSKIDPAKFFDMGNLTERSKVRKTVKKKKKKKIRE